MTFPIVCAALLLGFLNGNGPSGTMNAAELPPNSVWVIL